MRDIRVDLLRTLGLAMIILAHVGPPALIMQLRNFDVPLMILVSGMSFCLSYKQEAYGHYLWKRIKRLVFPVWIFLTIYFGVVDFFHLSMIKLSFNTVLRSYLLIDGIGYVWIIKVFLLVAAVSPFIYQVHRKIPINTIYLALVLIVLSCYEIFRIMSQDFFATDAGQSIASVTHYLIPYSLIFAIGLRLPFMTFKEILWCMAIALGFFISLAIYFWHLEGSFVPTQFYKYPPTLYYFSYAVAISCAAWALSGQVVALLNKAPILKNLILFIAQNSIWIYLWHIPFIKVIHTHFPLKFSIVLAIACAITFVQVWIVNNIITKQVSHPPMQRNIKMILTG